MINEINLSPNIVKNGRVLKSSFNEYFKDITTDKYSLKMPINGSEYYKIDSRNFNVNRNNYLITNPQQEVIVEVNSTKKVDGLCIYINSDIMMDVYVSADNLFSTEKKQLPLILGHSYAADFDNLGSFIKQLKLNLNTISKIDSDDFFYSLCHMILSKRSDVIFKYSKIDAIKKSTKTELFRILDTMHQIIQEEYKSDITLSILSKNIGLSKFHSLRLYKKIYGISPYQHIQSLRMKESVNLLQSNSIKEVSYILGYSDRKAFSKAFKKYYSISPSSYINR